MNQREVAGIVAASVGGTAEELAPYHSADFRVVSRSGNRCALEVKCRTVPMNRYRTYIIAEQKINRLMGLLGDPSEDFNCAGLAVRWSCGSVGLVMLPLLGYRVVMGGRVDRGDPRDVERVIEFPVDGFRLL